MKYILIISFLTIFHLYNAQIYPLNTFPDDVPVESYMKDLDNELTPFVGIWKTNYNGNTIILTIKKEEHKAFKIPQSSYFYYQDALVINYTIQNSNGIMLQNNNNVQHEYDKNAIVSMYVNNSIVNLYYIGTNCGVGWGTINLKKMNNTQISWSYYPNDTVLTTKNCPGNQDTTIYLPETKDLIFTKQ
jgi:hypothetical protein